MCNHLKWESSGWLYLLESLPVKRRIIFSPLSLPSSRSMAPICIAKRFTQKLVVNVFLVLDLYDYNLYNVSQFTFWLLTPADKIAYIYSERQIGRSAGRVVWLSYDCITHYILLPGANYLENSQCQPIQIKCQPLHCCHITISVTENPIE